MLAIGSSSKYTVGSVVCIVLYNFCLGSGSGAAWLAHLLWEQRVAGSNPVSPTTQKQEKPAHIIVESAFLVFGEREQVWVPLP